jgi:hypothetical protein
MRCVGAEGIELEKNDGYGVGDDSVSEIGGNDIVVANGRRSGLSVRGEGRDDRESSLGFDGGYHVTKAVRSGTLGGVHVRDIMILWMS